MKVSFTDRKKFILASIKQHQGLLFMWLGFTLVGGFFAYLGTNVEGEGLGFIIFGIIFILLSSAFMLFTLPSSIQYYYEQELTKKYGSYTIAKITNKRVDDYSHNEGSINNVKKEHVEIFLYAIEFEFNYNNTVYKNECFFEHKSTFDAITMETELPIKFLKTKPNKVTLRRRKLSNELGIPEEMCH